MFRFIRFFRNSQVDIAGTGGAVAVPLVDVATPRPRLVKPAKTAKATSVKRERSAETTYVRLPERAGSFARSDYDPFIGRRI